MDGLLGVAGIMKLLVSQWIIPENSLRSFWDAPSGDIFSKNPGSDCDVPSCSFMVLFWYPFWVQKTVHPGVYRTIF